MQMHLSDCLIYKDRAIYPKHWVLCLTPLLFPHKPQKYHGHLLFTKGS